MLALSDLGNEVRAFDTTPYLTARPRVSRSLAHRFNIGARLRWLNRDLAAWARTEGKARLAWIDKGKWIFPATVERLHETTQGSVVHFTPDPQLVFHQSRYFRAAIPLYDAVITTKPFELDEYRRLGARRLLLTGQAYDEVRMKGAVATAAYACDVGFIGHAERWYRQLLQVVAQEPRLDLKVWGPGWTSWRYRRGFSEVAAGLYGADYIAALKSMRIGIGLLSKWIPETTTTRTFEIPACGTFLLAERTAEHQQYFFEGKEAEFFSTPEELLDKVRFYLQHPLARERIATAGYARCVKSGYGNRARLAKIVDWAFQSDLPYADQRLAGSGQA